MKNSITSPKTADTTISPEKDFEILKLLYDEWKYRLTNFWSLMIRAITFAFILIFLPLIYENFKIDITALHIPLFLLPLTGAVISIIIGFFTVAEMCRIHGIKACIKDNIKKISTKYDAAITKGNQFNPYIPLVVCMLQVILASIIIFLIC